MEYCEIDKQDRDKKMVAQSVIAAGAIYEKSKISRERTLRIAARANI